MFASRYVKVLTAVLLLQAVGLLLITRPEETPPAAPLAQLSRQVGEWHVARDGVIEERVEEVLQADDLLTRVYSRPNRTAANLFIAYFGSQRSGKAPHSPKNCLPGSGWVPSSAGALTLEIPGRESPIEVNRYIVSRGEASSVDLYWYQSRDSVVASEYEAKMRLVLDSVRYNRSDTSLVRVVVPVLAGDVNSAQAAAEDFVRGLFPVMSELPQFRSA